MEPACKPGRRQREWPVSKVEGVLCQQEEVFLEVMSVENVSTIRMLVRQDECQARNGKMEDALCISDADQKTVHVRFSSSELRVLQNRCHWLQTRQVLDGVTIARIGIADPRMVLLPSSDRTGRSGHRKVSRSLRAHGRRHRR